MDEQQIIEDKKFWKDISKKFNLKLKEYVKLSCHPYFKYFKNSLDISNIFIGGEGYNDFEETVQKPILLDGIAEMEFPIYPEFPKYICIDKNEDILILGSNVSGYEVKSIFSKERTTKYLQHLIKGTDFATVNNYPINQNTNIELFEKRLEVFIRKKEDVINYIEKLLNF